MNFVYYKNIWYPLKHVVNVSKKFVYDVQMANCLHIRRGLCYLFSFEKSIYFLICERKLCISWFLKVEFYFRAFVNCLTFVLIVIRELRKSREPPASSSAVRAFSKYSEPGVINFTHKLKQTCFWGMKIFLLPRIDFNLKNNSLFIS